MGSRGVYNAARASPMKNDRLSPLKDERLMVKSDSIPSLENDRSESRPDPNSGSSRNSLRSEEASREDKKYNNDYSKGKFTGRITLKNPFGSSTTLSSQAPTEASDELEDHINVVLRVRPLNNGEIARKDQFTCSFAGAGKIEVDNNGSTRQFGYNVVFEPEASQEDLFEHSGVKKLIDMALNGYACTALAFGQTGSGKTHTMTGPPQQFQEGKQVDPDMYGIIQRSLKYLFSQLNQQQGTKIIRASYLEIYNEQVIDLLNPNMRRYLQVRWSKNKGFYVENLFVVECESVDDLMAVLEEGMRNRQTGSHGLNEFSSRSHSMLMLTIDSEQQDPEDENLYITKRGKLTFVDLAGSEKVKDSNSTAETLVESNNINRSLLILGNCISSLGDPKRRQGHIPYRDSKLTKLLADSLGGNGVTLMICCITPSSHHASETMNTLRYASRAKKIRTKPVVKMDPREKLILSLKKEIKVLRNENHYLRQQLEFPAKPKGQLQKENDQNFMKVMKETNGKPAPPNNTIQPQERLMQNGAKDESGLYEMLQEYMVENETLRADNSEMQVTRDKQRQEQQLLYRENEKLMKRVDELERKVNNAQNSWQAMPRQGSDHTRSRDHSPTRGSPQYVMPGSGGRQPPNRLPGYQSPTGSGSKGKQPNRGQPMKPPHRLNEPLPQQRPVQEQNGPYMNGHPHPAQFRQNPGSPNRSNEARMDSRRSSQSTSSDAIRDMNEKLKQELVQLEGQIHQHTALNTRNRNIYGSQGSIR